MKNILYVHQSAEMYGSDKVLLYLIENLNKNEFNPIILLPGKGPLSEKLEELSVEVHFVPLLLLSRSTVSPKELLLLPCRLFNSLVSISRLMRNKKIDLVHTNTLAVVSGAIWAKLNNIPHIWHVHELILRPALIRNIYAYLLFVLSDRVICVSSAVANNLLRDLNCLGEKIKVIWNGFRFYDSNNLEIQRVRRELGAREGDIICLLVGRISRWKGQQILIKAANLLWESGHRQIKFIFIGGAPPGKDLFLKNLYQMRMASPAKTNIEILDFDINIHKYWGAADIAIIPSEEPEPFGMVALEAMAMKKPVIASGHGGLCEIVIHRETGLLIEPSNPRILAAAIEELANHKKLRQDFGVAGNLRYCNYFTVTKFIEEVQRLYYKTLKV